MLNQFRKKVILAAISAAMMISYTGCKQETGGVANNEEKPVLKQLMVYQKEDYNTYPLTKDLEKATGYKVTYDMLPQDRWEDKLNMIMASGEDYDLITIVGTGRARYVDYASQGALEELTPLIDQYGPNIKKAVSEKTFEAAKVNGKLYSVPVGPTGGNDRTNTSSALAVRTDWMEKEGLKSPGTIDEFTKLLKDIKMKDPGGNGEKNIPLVISDAADVPGIYGAFGVACEWNLVDGKVVNRVEMPGYKEYLQYLHMLYENGLVDSEFPTNKTATMYEKFTSGQTAIIPLPWYDVTNVMDTLKKNFAGANFEYMVPPKGPRGDQGLGAGGGNGGFDRITFIPRTSKNKEHAIRYINAKLDPEVFKMMTIGVEGVHYTVKDGEYYPISPKFFDERGLANNYLAGIDEENYYKYWLVRLRKDENLYKAYQDLNMTKLLPYHYRSIKGSAPLTPETAKNTQTLKQVINDHAIKLIVGVESFDKFDEFVQEWKAKGGDQYTKDMNEWYSKSGNQ